MFFRRYRALPTVNNGNVCEWRCDQEKGEKNAVGAFFYPFGLSERLAYARQCDAFDLAVEVDGRGVGHASHKVEQLADCQI